MPARTHMKAHTLACRLSHAQAHLNLLVIGALNIRKQATKAFVLGLHGHTGRLAFEKLRRRASLRAPGRTRNVTRSAGTPCTRWHASGRLAAPAETARSKIRGSLRPTAPRGSGAVPRLLKPGAAHERARHTRAGTRACRGAMPRRDAARRGWRRWACGTRAPGVAEALLSTTEYGGHSMPWQNHGVLLPPSPGGRPTGIAAAACALCVRVRHVRGARVRR